MASPVTIGLEHLIDQPPVSLKNKRMGLLCNPASVDRKFTHAADLIAAAFNKQLTCLFSPQHGFYAEKQDNMIESNDFIEPRLNIPVFSLYGQTRIPTVRMFDHLDVLLVDIQDVGTRVYTFIYTVSYCMELAARLGKPVIILDRPNPIGGLQIEGNLLMDDFRSFVGRFNLPMRHGLTIGELCLYINKTYDIGCDLSIIQMTGWQRRMYWQDTGRFWVLPSPNLPSPLSAMVYPGQVIFEGTNVSEGRGTTLPFEMFGAPYMDNKKILNAVHDQLSGIHLRPVSFEPTSGKWQGQTCHGFQIHVTDKEKYAAYDTSLLLLQAIILNHPEDFAFTAPPYEYEYTKKPIDLILGSRQLRKNIENGHTVDRLKKQWQSELTVFNQTIKGYWLYDV
jgi:uncharacterized protein YbbC (DUF1343 family)